jgi:hypothetical protein
VKALQETPVAVYGRGNSSYARYNRGVDILHKALVAVGVDTVLPVAKGDNMANEVGSFLSFLVDATRVLVDEPASLLMDSSKTSMRQLNLDDNAQWRIRELHSSLHDLPLQVFSLPCSRP